MRNGIIGGFFGVFCAAIVLAACGSGSSAPTNLTQAEVDAQLAVLQQQIDDLSAQLSLEVTALDDHAADTAIHGLSTPTPVLGLNYCISLTGTVPTTNLSAKIGGVGTALSADPLLAGVGLFAGNFAPRGWAFCQGQLLSISSNPDLFALLGTTYGGDGQSSFGLPDLRERAVMHPQNPGLLLGQQRD